MSCIAGLIIKYSHLSEMDAFPRSPRFEAAFVVLRVPNENALDFDEDSLRCCAVCMIFHQKRPCRAFQSENLTRIREMNDQKKGKIFHFASFGKTEDVFYVLFAQKCK